RRTADRLRPPHRICNPRRLLASGPNGPRVRIGDPVQSSRVWWLAAPPLAGDVARDRRSRPGDPASGPPCPWWPARATVVALLPVALRVLALWLLSLRLYGGAALIRRQPVRAARS